METMACILHPRLQVMRCCGRNKWGKELRTSSMIVFPHSPLNPEPPHR